MAEPDDMDPNKPVTRAELKEELAKFPTKEDLARFEERLFAELARHSLANQESMSGQVGVVDERYKDLPERVLRLEHAVFKPRRRARRS